MLPSYIVCVKQESQGCLILLVGIITNDSLSQCFQVFLSQCCALQIMSTGPEAPLRLKVEGLKCEACSARLKKHVLSSTSVHFCEIDFASKQMTVRGDISDASEIVNAVESLGYSASTIPD